MTNQSAARTTLYDPSNLAPECFFQLAHLLDSEYHADKAKLVESLRFVADTLVQEGWAGLPGDV